MKPFTEEQHASLHALAQNPKYARKLLAVIEASPRLASALWDVCSVAAITSAFY